jgi:hypothetical protein
VDATPVGFSTHTFSVSSFGLSKKLPKEANVRIFSGVAYQGPEKHPQYDYEIYQPFSKVKDIYVGDDVGDVDTTTEITFSLNGSASEEGVDISGESQFLLEKSARATYDKTDTITVGAQVGPLSGDRIDTATSESIELQSFLILVNGSLVDTITGTPVTTGTLDVPIRTYMKEGGGVTVDIIPFYVEL